MDVFINRRYGEAIARAYLEQGENVVLTGRRTDRLQALKSELQKLQIKQFGPFHWM